jgi:hypothetical protein
MPTWLDEFEESLRRTGATGVLPPTPQAPLGFTPPGPDRTLLGPNNPAIPPPPPPPLDPRLDVSNMGLIQPPPPTPPSTANMMRDIGRSLALGLTGINSASAAGRSFAEGDILSGVGNMGMALMPYRPMLGLGMFGGALGGALGADLGIGRTPPANAQAPPEPPQAQPISREQFMRENRTQRTTLDAALANAEKGVRESAEYQRFINRGMQISARRLIDQAVERARRAHAEANSEAALSREEDRLGQAYDRYLASFNAQRDRTTATANAEAARDRELARERRFSDTYTGRAFDLAGGFAPGVVGGLTGLLTRGAGRAIGWGGGAGLFSAHVPLGYEALFAPTDNPRRRALEEYAAALPRDDPRRANALEDAARMPEQNPIRREAMDQLFDTWGLVKRSAMGLGEGALGGHLGHALAGTPDRVLQWLRGLRNRPPPGSSGPNGPTGGPATPPTGNPNPPPPNAPPPPPPSPSSMPSLADRRAIPNPADPSGHWVPPGASSRAGETERWVSPAGQNEVYRDRLGRWWQRIRNGPARPLPNGPPQTYRRISSVPFSFGSAIG